MVATVSMGDNVATTVMDNELYSSDEFRMYCMKVLPCSKRFVHDWPSCPFAHPGEKAKRRDPRTHQYDCEMCPSVAKGETCELGAACPHSHHVFESWLHPQKYRTLLCKDGDHCRREICFFAHGSKQLRSADRSPQQCCVQPRLAHTAPLPVIQIPRNGSRRASYSLHSPGPKVENNVACPSTMQSGAAAADLCQQLFLGMQLDGNINTCLSGIVLPEAHGHGQGQQCGAVAGLTPAHVAAHHMPAPKSCQMLSAPLPTLQTGVAVQQGPSSAAGDSHMVQLMQQLAAEASASQQELDDCTRAAAFAQQKLQLLQQMLFPNGMPHAVNDLQPQVSAADVLLNMSSGVSTPGMTAPSQVPLMQMQRMLAQQAYSDIYPRRHSVDERLLHGSQNTRTGGLASHMDAASPWGTYGAAATGMGGGLSLSGGEATSDVLLMPSTSDAGAQSLAAALATVGLQDTAQLQAAAGFGMFPPAVQTALPTTAPVDAAAQVPGSYAAGCSGNLPDIAAAARLTWPGRGAAAFAPVQQARDVTSFHSAGALPTIPSRCGGDMFTTNCFSEPQLQTDYLLQLKAMLQDSQQSGGPGTSVPAALQAPTRASFDTAAAYLPCLRSGMREAAVMSDTAANAGMLLLPVDDDSAGSEPTGSIAARESGNSTPKTNDAYGIGMPTDELMPIQIGGAQQLRWL